MVHSEDCVRLVASFEGFSAKAYQDSGGVWTIGYGTAFYPDGSKVKEGDSCTQAGAEVWLDRNLLKADDAIRKYVTVPLNQSQWDSLCSFIYNVGAGAFSTSTCLDALTHGDYQKAADAMFLFDKVNHVFNQGLANRRKAERLLFLKPAA